MIDWKKKVVLFGFGDTMVHPIRHKRGFGILFYTAKEPVSDMKELVRRKKFEIYFPNKECLNRYIQQLQSLCEILDTEESDQV